MARRPVAGEHAQSEVYDMRRESYIPRRVISEDAFWELNACVSYQARLPGFVMHQTCFISQQLEPTRNQAQMILLGGSQ